jgi:hypothetical protein
MAEVDFKEELVRFLDELGYDFTQFTIGGFAHWIAAQNGRPIELHRLSLPADMFGAWIPGRHADHIFYDDGPFPFHCTHILLHELSHVLLNHRPQRLNAEVADALEQTLTTSAGAQGLDHQLQDLPGLLRTLRYTDQQELEAETLSGLIQLRVFQHAGLVALTRPIHHPGMRGLVESLGLDR